MFGDSGTDGSSSLTFDPNGQFESLDDTESASDAFMYTASDGDTDSVPADVDMTITGVNDSPVANNDSGTTNEDTVLTVAAPGVLGNDTDVDVEPLTVAEINGSAVDVGSQITLASGAKATLNADGSYGYTPSPAHQALDTGESALDSFTYKASDGTVSSNSATVTITITGVNDAPVANNDSGTRRGHRPDRRRPGVLDNDTDVDVEALSVAERTARPSTSAARSPCSPGPRSPSTPTARTATRRARPTRPSTPASRPWTASPTRRRTGPSSNSATVTITITGVNDAPVANNDSGTTTRTPS